MYAYEVNQKCKRKFQVNFDRQNNIIHLYSN